LRGARHRHCRRSRLQGQVQGGSTGCRTIGTIGTIGIIIDIRGQHAT